MSVDAIDNVAIKQVRMKNPVGDGPDIILTPSGNGVAYYTVFDTRSIPNGAQLFTVYAIDTAGLLSVTQATVTVKIDNLAPSILFDVSDGAVLTQKKSIVVTSADSYSLLEDSLLSYPDTYNSNFVVRDTENNGFIHFQVAPESLPRGDYKVTAWAKDLAGNENTKILTLKAALNSPPFSHDMALTVNKNSSIEFEPSIEDPDSADLPDDTITNGPFHGKIIQHDPYTFTYRPDVNYIGADSFQYFAKDKILNLSLPATAYVYVRSPGDSKEAQIPGFVSAEILSVVISSPATNTVGDFMVMGASVVADELGWWEQ